MAMPARRTLSSFCWTSAATSSGTKKIRRIVSVFGRFIAQTKYNAARLLLQAPRAYEARPTYYTDISAMILSRRHFFFGSLALPSLAAAKSAGDRPNVLLILVDGLPAWMLGCYGGKDVRTPNIDQLSGAGGR